MRPASAQLQVHGRKDVPGAQSTMRQNSSSNQRPHICGSSLEHWSQSKPILLSLKSSKVGIKRPGWSVAVFLDSCEEIRIKSHIVTCIETLKSSGESVSRSEFFLGIKFKNCQAQWTNLPGCTATSSSPAKIRSSVAFLSW